MIIRERPTFLDLVFALKGSILPKIAPALVALALISLALTVADKLTSGLPHLPLPIFLLMGTAISLFLGFRNNAAYARWWEARIALGTLLANTRSFARESAVAFHAPADRHPILRRARSLHQRLRHELRGSTAPDTLPQSANAILNAMAAEIREAKANRRINSLGTLLLTQRLGQITADVTACERLSNTPMPYVYSLLVYRTVWMFCLLVPFGLLAEAGWMTPVFTCLIAYTFLGLAEVTEELAHPFRMTENGLPLDAIVRAAEISLAPFLNEAAPPPLTPRGYRLD